MRTPSLAASERTECRSEWSKIIADLGIPNAVLRFQSKVDPGRRIYISGSTAYKIRAHALDITGSARKNDLQAEYRLLRKGALVDGVPKAGDYFRGPTYEAFSMEYVSGTPLLTSLGIVRTLFETIRFVCKLSLNGISHNDYKLDNFIVAESGQWYLVDFDQATEETSFAAFVAGLTGILVNQSVSRTPGSAITIIKELAMSFTPAALTHSLRRLIRKRSYSKCPELPSDAPATLHALLEAWRLAQRSNASSPGEAVAYYALDYGGYHFPGERPWDDRWRQIQGAIDVRGKRILELGCNLALLSNWMLLYKGAAEAYGVDADEDILRAARIVSQVFGTSPRFEQVDFDLTQNWEASLVDYSADVVFALSVLNWIKDKDRFLRFLAKHKEVLFEGHEKPQQEERRLRAAGFSTVELVAVSERRRPLFYCVA